MAQFNFSPYDAKQQEIDRRAQYAEMLRQQGMEAPQGGMAGGIYVAPSITQGLAQMLKAYGGRKGVETADRQSQALASERQAKMAEALKGYGAGGDPTALLENPDTAMMGAQALAQQQRDRTAAERDAVRFRAQEDRQRKQNEQALLMFKEREAAADARNQASIDARLAAAQMGGGGQAPANVQEWEYYSKLSPEQQQAYLAMKRATGWQNAGGELIAPNPTNPAAPPLARIPRTLPPEQDPALKGEQAAAAAAGRVEGEAGATAQRDLPNAVAGAEQTVGIIDKMLSHPGLSSAVGAKGPAMLFGALDSPIAGTEAADFMALRDQLGGKQFLEAFESLKGGGQITQVEGEKATNAIARMQTAQSEKAFREAASEFRAVVEAAKNRAVQRAGGAQAATPNGAAAQSVDEILKLYEGQ